MNQSTPALQTEKAVLDGHQVETTVLPGLFALRLKTRLMKKILPALGKFVSSINLQEIVKLRDGGEKKKSLADVIACLNMDDVGASVETLVCDIEPEELQDIVLQSLSQTRVDGKEAGREDVFNLIFAGNLLFMYKVLFFVLGVNYSDFFSFLRTGMAALKKVPAPETKKSTPPSGKSSAN